MTTTGLLDSMDSLFHVIRDNPIGLAQGFSLFKFLSKASKPSKKGLAPREKQRSQIKGLFDFQHDSFFSQELLQGTELSWS
jgi:hypothetical protein